ncbi:UDP-glucose dehydrogenase family protein [Neobacillus sp. LXY-1]|uniref:UDP-glucose dehydrogenase family protein n=1 Tax=Neobacillus sp. LXY-1 TaxID=3379133 RepID=UPI003EE29CC5
MKILVIGTGYVGTTTGLLFCEMGHKVTGLDLDEKKIKSLKSGKLHFYEPGLEDLLAKHISQNHISFTRNAKKAIKENDVIFICVGTPQDKNGDADLSYVKSVAESIGTYMNEYKVIVTKSTVPVGTSGLVSKWIREKQEDKIKFDVVSNPEFLREGSALHDALNPDRIIIGTTGKKAMKIMKSLYEPFACPTLETLPEAAEMIKYASNSFLAMKISYINELAKLCDELEINVNDVSKGIGMDQRIGPAFLQAGMGYGGSCFPKDVSALIYLAKKSGNPLTILESVVKVNEEQTSYFLKKIKHALGGKLKNRKIAILGLAFKANTDDTRESASLYLIEKLMAEQAEVTVHDPVVKWGTTYQRESIEETVKGADAVCICTDWEDYKKINWTNLKSLMNQPYIFDGRNILSKTEMEKIGFHYMGVANG